MAIDWTKPIEAYHEDGRVVPVELDADYPQPDVDGDYALSRDVVEDGPCIFRADGSQWQSNLGPWRIRNRADQPATPQPTPDTLTLRDQFAMAALPAIIAATSAGQHFPGKGFDDDRAITERMAADAYSLADAMISERNREREA